MTCAGYLWSVTTNLFTYLLIYQSCINCKNY